MLVMWMGHRGDRSVSYLATTDKAFVLVVAKGALVADADERRGAHVRVAHGALAVALVAETANGDTCCLATHDQITVSFVSLCLLLK